MRKVAYFHNWDVEKYSFGHNHPMKPMRLGMTHTLIKDYDLLDLMNCHSVADAKTYCMLEFHDYDYVRFLEQPMAKNYTVDWNRKCEQFNVGGDCPLFEGVFDFCAKYTGASLAAADMLMNGGCDVAINWSGGLHHAKKSSASGFCFINDIVLAILRMLRRYRRVLYIDIDVHHGDGVQEAFYSTDRVMTMSFHHLSENFFPGTGLPEESGFGEGLGYAINIPLKQGIDDAMYDRIFKPIVRETVDHYRPECIVLQCGADSLHGDLLGYFSLSINGHGECVRFVKSLGIPMLVLGGGGYTPRNVARCWAYETSVLLDVEIPNVIPEQNAYRSAYGPTFLLSPPMGRLLPNLNPESDLDVLHRNVSERLRAIPSAPNVGLGDNSITFFPKFLLAD